MKSLNRSNEEASDVLAGNGAMPGAAGDFVNSGGRPRSGRGCRGPGSGASAAAAADG